MSDIAQLRAAMREAASKATGGEWTWEGVIGDPYDLPTLYADRTDEQHGLNLLGRLDPDHNGKANLNHIALANPANVTRLLDALDRADALAVAANELRDAADLIAKRLDRADALLRDLIAAVDAESGQATAILAIRQYVMREGDETGGRE